MNEEEINKLIAAHARKHFGKGIRKKRFRQTVNPPVNRILRGVLYADKITTYAVQQAFLRAGKTISMRTIEAWYGGQIPYQENQDILCNFLGLPPHILFNEEDIKRRMNLKTKPKETGLR